MICKEWPPNFFEESNTILNGNVHKMAEMFCGDNSCFVELQCTWPIWITRIQKESWQRNFRIKLMAVSGPGRTSTRYVLCLYKICHLAQWLWQHDTLRLKKKSHDGQKKKINSSAMSWPSRAEEILIGRKLIVWYPFTAVLGSWFNQWSNAWRGWEKIPGDCYQGRVNSNIMLFSDII